MTEREELEEAKRVLVVSPQWPSYVRSGVAWSAFSHSQMLSGMGYKVSILGDNNAIELEDLDIEEAFAVRVSGSGAMYSPVRGDKAAVRDIIRVLQPVAVIVEGLQSAISQFSIEEAYNLNIPVLLVSHGVSVCPMSASIEDKIRALAWSIYRKRTLPKLLRKVAAVTTLDESSSSTRFYDRDIARRIGKEVFPLVNTPRHIPGKKVQRMERGNKVLVVGYFSRIKNQLEAIEIVASIRRPVLLTFVGDRKGLYYEQCLARVKELGLSASVRFLQDNECDLAVEFASSCVVLCTSISEALPITLLESMASGTPFIAPPVGACQTLRGGLFARSRDDASAALERLLTEAPLWEVYSNSGYGHYVEKFTDMAVRNQLKAAVMRVEQAR